jgi:type IV pilus biogenesis protein PilP
MKKVLLIMLVVASLPLYSYNIFLLMQASFSGRQRPDNARQPRPGQQFEQMLLAAQPVRFDTAGRDPFTLYSERRRPAAVAVAPVPVSPKTVSKKEVVRPQLTITGIMWNPGNPVAMITLPGGAKTLAKAGQDLGGGCTVKRIEQKSVVVTFEGREFTYER